MNDSIQPTLIAGDSFSAAPSIWPNAWASCWPDALNIAVRGNSNWDIMKGLDKQPLQPAIINFSHLYRFPRKYNWNNITEVERAEWKGSAHRLNCMVVDRVIHRWKDHALFWTAFPGYGRWPEVYWHFSREIDWQKWNQKAIIRQQLPLLTNHMSLRGIEEWQKIVKSLWALKVKKSVALRAKLQTMDDRGEIDE
jgi:hypothetical protein